MNLESGDFEKLVYLFVYLYLLLVARVNMPHLSTELRELIVVWRHEQDKSVLQIAELADCSSSTVYEVLRLHREYGTASNPNAHARGRPRVLDTAAKDYIASLLEANPVLYLDEIQERLYEAQDIHASIATISRAVRQLGISHKSVSTEAAERNEILRATWKAAHGDIPMEYFVWLDESSVDDQTNQRRYGWAPLGRACVCRDTFLRGQRFSVLPALTCDGIIALDIFEGSVNKERFIRFLEEQLVRNHRYTSGH